MFKTENNYILYMIRTVCLGSSVGKSMYPEHGRSWVQIPPEAAPFLLKMTTLGVLCCIVLPCLSKSLIVRVAMYMYQAPRMWERLLRKRIG